MLVNASDRRMARSAQLPAQSRFLWKVDPIWAVGLWELGRSPSNHK